MHSQLDPKRHFPSLPKKPQGVSSIFELIRIKKAEFARQIEEIEGVEVSLPHIHSDKKESEEEETRQEEDKSSGEPQENKSNEPSAYKYRTILDPNSRAEKSNTISSKLDNAMSLSRKQNVIELKNRNNRTKTEFNQVEARKLTSNTSAAQANHDLQDDLRDQKVEQARRNFQTAIELVPRAVKQRNEENLTDSILCLQTFNPFFLRNHRIVNICLLKMGRILMRDSPFQLHKAGDEVEHFYIILSGKVKIADGFVKRVCQTGETVLEEVLFSDKGRKLALQRAKVIGPTYLLEFHLQEYHKLKEELIRYGLKLAFHEMQAIIKRNFIIKNWMRNKKKTQGRR